MEKKVKTLIKDVFIETLSSLGREVPTQVDLTTGRGVHTKSLHPDEGRQCSLEVPRTKLRIVLQKQL